MKKLLLILLSAMALTAVAQETIALLEPRVGDGSTPVSGLEKRMVQGELRKAIVSLPGYEAITRNDIDQMMQEQDFQRTGLVSDDQRKKLGEMSGADYICVSTLTKSDTEFYLEAYLVHLESGKMSNPASKYGELANGKFANLFPACQELAQELLGGDSSSPISSEIWLPEGKYVGEIKNGKPHGKGIMYYKESDEKERTSYDGDWRNGIRHGYGILKWKNGNRYEGQWDNGSWNGQGTAYFANGAIYSGNWKNDSPNGQGTYTDDEGRKYVGNFKNGAYSGQGKLYWPNGDIYEGNFENNSMFGYGTVYFADGRKYVGNWKDGLRDGYGVITTPQGDKYEGNWEHDKLNGQGTFYFANGQKYIGEWKDNQRSGKGTQYLEEGYRVGMWANDSENGYFTVYMNDGSKFQGYYVNGKAEGEWLYTHTNGNVLRATYSNGNIVVDWH